LVFLGRLGFEKRVDLLIKAFELKRKQPNCSLVIGDGPADVVNRLKRLAEQFPDITSQVFFFEKQG